MPARRLHRRCRVSHYGGSAVAAARCGCTRGSPQSPPPILCSIATVRTHTYTESPCRGVKTVCLRPTRADCGGRLSEPRAVPVCGGASRGSRAAAVSVSRRQRSSAARATTDSVAADTRGTDGRPVVPWGRRGPHGPATASAGAAPRPSRRQR